MATTTKKADSTAETVGFEAIPRFDAASYKKSYDKFAEGVSSIADLQKGSIEAFVASAGAFAKGIEKVTKEQTAYFKAAYDDGVATAKAATSSKSVQEAIELNAGYFRGALEKNLSQINKVADLWIETVKESAEPLTDGYSELVDKVQAYRP
jgi:phasin family protein